MATTSLMDFTCWPRLHTKENITSVISNEIFFLFPLIFAANIATFFSLTEPSQTETPELSLGEPSLKFKLSFKDLNNNSATMFSSGEFVKLLVTCPNLEVQGVKDKYKPNNNGVLEVSGIVLTPNGSGKVQYGRDIYVRVEVVGIDFVTFPVRIKAGERKI